MRPSPLRNLVELAKPRSTDSKIADSMAAFFEQDMKDLKYVNVLSSLNISV